MTKLMQREAARRVAAAKRPPTATTTYYIGGGPRVPAAASDERRPARRRALTPLLALAVLVAALLIGFLVVVRPWYRQWGATDEEARRALPGDAIVWHAAGQETRAITIEASVDRVWPWIAQLGQDRGGFYSYDILENLVGCQMPTEDVLRPDRQQWAVGDRLWMYPKERAGGAGFATLRELAPGRALAFGTRALGTPLDGPEDGSWSFVLVPLGDSATRLLVRGRVAERPPLAAVFDELVFEPMHFAMERRTMIGIKQLAEGRDRGRVANHVQVMLWAIAAGMLVAGVAMVARRRPWARYLAGVALGAVVFQVLTLLQPPLWIGALLVTVVGTVLWPPAPARAASAVSASA